MKRSIRYIMFALAALLFGTAGGGAPEAQTSTTTAREGRPALAAPIKVVGAITREVPSRFMRKLAPGERSRPVEVLDLAVEVSARALNAFPPSLQPLLYIGAKAYPVQRSEYSNWDLRTEKPIDPRMPVGEIVTLHFFIEDWREIERDQPMILSILTAAEMRKETGGVFTVERLIRVMPEATERIPRYVPHEFMRLGP